MPITICFMVVNSVFIEWNINIKFPEFMAGFERWAQAKEEELKRVTEYLTNFSGFNELLVAMVVVAYLLVLKSFRDRLTDLQAQIDAQQDTPGRIEDFSLINARR